MIIGNDKFRWPALKRVAALLLALGCLFAGVEGKGAPRRAKTGKGKTKSSSHKRSKSIHHRSSSTKAVKHSSHSHRKSSFRSTRGKRRGLPRSSRARLAALHLDPQRAEEIQQALIREGFLTGPATGSWDDATREAMRRYQSKNGFSATGLPDAKSLMKLGLGPHPLPEDIQPAAAQAKIDPATKTNPN